MIVLGRPKKKQKIRSKIGRQKLKEEEILWSKITRHTS